MVVQSFIITRYLDSPILSVRHAIFVKEVAEIHSFNDSVDNSCRMTQRNKLMHGRWEQRSLILVTIFEPFDSFHTTPPATYFLKMATIWYFQQIYISDKNSSNNDVSSPLA